MIFELFLAFAVLSVIFIFVAYYVDIKVLAVLGFATLFFLGLLLQFDGVTIRSGESDAYAYVCSACGIPGNTSYYCGGTPTVCSFYETEQTCELYQCTWNVNVCEGTPECSVYTDMTLCGRAGCDVVANVTNGTAGVNATVVGSVTTTFVYSTIDDSTSVWIGRWLSIVSALGVALVFASNRREGDA